MLRIVRPFVTPNLIMAYNEGNDYDLIGKVFIGHASQQKCRKLASLLDALLELNLRL